MTAEEKKLRREMERQDDIVRAAGWTFHRHSQRAPSGGGVDWNDPYEELARREEEAIREATVEALEVTQTVLNLESLPTPIVERVHALVFDEFRQYEETLLEWLFEAGPLPIEVMRRLFAYVKMKRASLLWNMGFRKLGPLLHETHASAAIRTKVLFGDAPAGWKKTKDSCAKMKEAQMGNNNRKGGKKMRPPEGYPFQADD